MKGILGKRGDELFHRVISESATLVSGLLQVAKQTRERYRTHPEDDPFVHVDVDDRVLLKLSSSGMTTRSYDAYELFAPVLPKKPPIIN